MSNRLTGQGPGLSDLRQQLGYDSVPAGYDIAGAFDYHPLIVTLPELEPAALQNRPDLRAAQQGSLPRTASTAWPRRMASRMSLWGQLFAHQRRQRRDVSMSIPLAIFDRNQGEIARTRYAITQAQEQQKAVNGQVLTDVRDAYEGMRSNDRVIQFYRSGNLEAAQRNRDISEYAYQRGAISLLDFLDTERSYRATQLAYRQVIGAYLRRSNNCASGRNQEFAVNREEVRSRIQEVGIIPAVRLYSAEDALFAAEAVCGAGIPIVEVTMTVPGAVEVIRELTRHNVGAHRGSGHGASCGNGPPLPGCRRGIFDQSRGSI